MRMLRKLGLITFKLNTFKHKDWCHIQLFCLNDICFIKKNHQLANNTFLCMSNPLNCSQSMTSMLPLLYRLLEHLKSHIHLQSQNSQFQSGTKGRQIMFCKLMVLQSLHYSYPCLRLDSLNYIRYLDGHFHF